MNLPNLLIPVVIVVLSWAAGYLDGTEEAEKINAGKRIAHWWELTIRVVFLLLGLGVMYLIHEWFGTPQWKLFCIAGMAFGVFVPTHRYYVNTRRTTPKRDWWWMGEPLGYERNGASKYDTAWHWIAWKLSGGGTSRRYVEETPKPFYRGKLPAQCAYGFEAFVLILSTTIYVLA